MTALICLTYDDALPCHREAVAPALIERGLHATFYIPAGREDLHRHRADWRKVANMGHELGNHSCWHPCRTRTEWQWKPPYRLEDYTRTRIRKELLLANYLLKQVDGRDDRTYAATCGDLTCGPGEGVSFLEDIQGLFPAIRCGDCSQAMSGPVPYIIPGFHGDFRTAAEIITIIITMKEMTNAWFVVAFHGVGMGTHQNFIDSNEHNLMVDWISTQCEWLEAVTLRELAVKERGKQETSEGN